MPECAYRHLILSTAVINRPIKCLVFRAEVNFPGHVFPSFLPHPLYLLLAPFFARSLFRNSTETLAAQANSTAFFRWQANFWCFYCTIREMKPNIFEIFRTLSRYVEKKLGISRNIFRRFQVIFVPRATRSLTFSLPISLRNVFM